MRFLLFIFLISIAFSQVPNPNIKPYPTIIKMSWNVDTTGSIAEYYICYIQGSDTSIFSHYNFVEGASYDSIKDWFIGSTIKNYFYFSVYEVNSISFVRVGVIGLKFDGTFTPLAIIPKCLKIRPNIYIKGIRIN